MPHNTYACFLGFDDDGKARYTLPEGAKRILEDEKHPFKKHIEEIINDRRHKLSILRDLDQNNG